MPSVRGNVHAWREGVYHEPATSLATTAITISAWTVPTFTLFATEAAHLSTMVSCPNALCQIGSGLWLFSSPASVVRMQPGCIWKHASTTKGYANTDDFNCQ